MIEVVQTFKMKDLTIIDAIFSRSSQLKQIPIYIKVKNLSNKLLIGKAEVINLEDDEIKFKCEMDFDRIGYCDGKKVRDGDFLIKVTDSCKAPAGWMNSKYSMIFNINSLLIIDKCGGNFLHYTDGKTHLDNSLEHFNGKIAQCLSESFKRCDKDRLTLQPIEKVALLKKIYEELLMKEPGYPNDYEKSILKMLNDKIEEIK